MTENKATFEQNVFLTEREKITVTGIKSVDSFDDTMITATTVHDTVINIEGEELSIKDVNLDRGQLEAGGIITAVYYDTGTTVSKRGLLGRIFSKS